MLCRVLSKRRSPANYITLIIKFDNIIRDVGRVSVALCVSKVLYHLVGITLLEAPELLALATSERKGELAVREGIVAHLAIEQVALSIACGHREGELGIVIGIVAICVNDLLLDYQTLDRPILDVRVVDKVINIFILVVNFVGIICEGVVICIIQRIIVSNRLHLLQLVQNLVV